MSRSYVIEVGWGEYLDRQIRAYCARADITPSALFEAVGEVTGDQSRNTISKLVDGVAPPVSAKDRSRAVVLVTAIGEKLSTFELEKAALIGLLADLTLPEIRDKVRSKYAPRDSNPEPADLGHIVPNSVTSDLIAQPDQAVVAA